MQCHRCPKNGKPDEACLTCKCAEYLDNDHKVVTPVPDTSVLPIEKPCGKARFPVPDEVVRDCLDVTETLKHCDRQSFPYLLKLFVVFASLGSGAPLFQHVLCGGTFTSYAVGEGRQGRRFRRGGAGCRRQFPKSSASRDAERTGTMHDEYWRKAKVDAERRLHGLFKNTRTKVADIVGDENGIDEREDAKAVLAYVLKHGSCEEVACAILSSCEWQQACRELEEHSATVAK